MKIEIKEKKEMPLLSRTEVHGKVNFDKATPSNDDVKAAVAADMKADESLVVVKQILTEYGEHVADFVAYVYKDKSALEKTEPKKKEKKEGEAKPKEATPEAKAKEKPAESEESKAAEKPSEEKPKEEAKPEEKGSE